ncbi:hypothetical protein O181_039282 [Austropuccinia psidii MF-1]|uniref:[Histone H3]-trimethyl-L-lysine(9) demethylase n=1 Tax=Austropuccinia psidii MF-1 TaxID=1389203 RepID=A0A9Q3DCK7_9BASI|nr:hypothetical protein [Austropuccinia psidii MF-1]
MMDCEFSQAPSALDISQSEQQPIDLNDLEPTSINHLQRFNQSNQKSVDPIPPIQPAASSAFNPILPDRCGSKYSESDSSGPDYYTSDSDSESEFDLSPKRRQKRQRLRAERDQIKPSYYYGEKELEQEAIQKGASRPKIKRKGLRGVPVFEPSFEQFKDFYSYINLIDRWGMRSGIIKIIPPKEWSDQLPNLGQESLRTDGKGQMLREAKIKSPISQVIQGSRGLFRVMNVAKRKNYNALDWYDLANSSAYRPPDFFNKTAINPNSHDDLNQDNSTESLDSRFVRSTRSSRRSTTQVTPISHKQSIARKRKVSKPVFTNDSNSTDHLLIKDPADLSSSALSILSTQQTNPAEPTFNNDSNLIDHTLVKDPSDLSSSALSIVPTQQAYPAKPVDDLDEAQEKLTLNSSNDPSCLSSLLLHHPPSYSSNCPHGNDVCRNTNSLVHDLHQPIVDQSDCSEQLTIHDPQPSSSVFVHQPDIISDSLDQPLENQAEEKKKQKRSGPTSEEWAEFIQKYDELPYGSSKSDYTVKVCREIEQEYWRTIGNGAEPIYGADTTGSLFDERTENWNIANLDNLLTRWKLRKRIPGVNTPYLYFGTWRATFAWHVEDADLYSINYIHFGAPKFWYAIPQVHNPKFENFMSSSFAKERRTCPEFLRHKAFLASPSVLQSVGIQLNRVVHLPGEIILTYPYGYHSGFNMGYNCAESVNFANEDWVEKGKKARSCKCIDDSVTIDVEAWVKENEELCHKEVKAREKALKKLEHEKKKEERKRLLTDQSHDDQQPRKKKKKSSIQPGAPLSAEQNESVFKKPIDPQLAGPSQELNPKKKRKSDGNAKVLHIGESGSNGPVNRKKLNSNGEIRPNLKKSKVDSLKKHFPCALCPDSSEDGLLRIVESLPLTKATQLPQEDQPTIEDSSNIVDNEICPLSKSVDSILPLKINSKPKIARYAHKTCCMFTPSTWIETLESGEQVIKGFEEIEKARWALKCQLCNEMMGIKVQCTKSEKCAKACHVSCGLKAETFFLDAQLVKGDLKYSLLDPLPGGPPEGLDIGQDPTLIILCKQHNPIYRRILAEKKANELAEKVFKFSPGQPIKVRTSKGVFQVFFHSRDEIRRTLKVTFEDGNFSELPYSKVYFGTGEKVVEKAIDDGEKFFEVKEKVHQADHTTKYDCDSKGGADLLSLSLLGHSQLSPHLSQPPPLVVTSLSSPTSSTIKSMDHTIHRNDQWSKPESTEHHLTTYPQTTIDDGRLQLLADLSAADSIHSRPYLNHHQSYPYENGCHSNNNNFEVTDDTIINRIDARLLNPTHQMETSCHQHHQDSHHHNDQNYFASQFETAKRLDDNNKNNDQKIKSIAFESGHIDSRLL